MKQVQSAASLGPGAIAGIAIISLVGAASAAAAAWLCRTRLARWCQWSCSGASVASIIADESPSVKELNAPMLPPAAAVEADPCGPP